MTFSVSPGIGLYGASFGYQMGDIVPIVGVAVLSGSSSVEDNYMRWNETTQTYEMVDRTEDVSATVVMPYFGLKYFLSNSGKLKPYVSAIFWKPFISSSYEDSMYPEDNEDNDYIDNLSLIGIEAGFGTEYFFDKNFSIGGEFGFRMLFGGTETTETDYYWNGNEDIEYERTYKISGLFDYTYARMTLNFYF